MVWLTLCFALLQGQDHLQVADELIRNGDDLMAEIQLLDAIPGDHQVVATAERLVLIARRSGALAEKRRFFHEASSDQANQRAVFLLATALLAADQRDWTDFADPASRFFRTFPKAVEPVRLRLLYHLARHTRVAASFLSLTPMEQEWFKACRDLPSERLWPAVDHPLLPYRIRVAHLLEQGRFDSFPPPGDAFEDRFTAQLLVLRQHLDKQDFNAAAGVINQLRPIDQTDRFPELKGWFLPMLGEYYTQAGKPQNTAIIAENLRIHQQGRAFMIFRDPERIRELKTLPTQPDPSAVTTSEPTPPATASTVPETIDPPTNPPPEPIESEASQDPVIIPTTSDLTEPAISEDPSAPAQTTTTPPEASDEQEPSVPTPEPITPSPAPSVDPYEEQASPPDMQPDKLGLEEVPAPDDAPPSSIEKQPAEPVVEPANDPPPSAIPSMSPSEPEPDNSDALARGAEMMQAGDHLMAEAHFLGLTPARADIEVIAASLADVALRLGNTRDKQDFYKELTDQQGHRASIGHLVLAILSQNERDWDSYGEHATHFLVSNPTAETMLRLRLLYHLARHTSAADAGLSKDSLEREWFQAARATAPEKTWPVLRNDSFPFALRQAHLLESNQEFELPDPGPTPTQDDTFFLGLLQIKRMLLQGDSNEAATTINQISSESDKQANPDIRRQYLALRMAYFNEQGDPERVDRLDQEILWISERTQLPMIGYPDHIRSIASDQQKTRTRQDLLARTPTRETQPLVPASSTNEPVTERPRLDTGFEDLERELRKSPRGLELRIQAQRADTDFKRIYKNYLLGLLYLKKGRLNSAYERLALAENLIVGLPFPNLESKILQAMGLYYEFERNLSQAEWYRIAAVQLWKESQNLPVFAMVENQVTTSPFRDLVDDAILRSSEEEYLPKALFYSEMDHLDDLRKRAFQREVLSANPVLGTQLKSVGNQIATMITDLAMNPDHQTTPQRYLDTVAVWDQLWNQVSPIYSRSDVPTLGELRKRINKTDRVLKFIEGHNSLGVLVLSQDQSFLINLGKKANFEAIPDDQKFGFLEARLGPVWLHQGNLLVNLCPTVRTSFFINQLRLRMPDPERLQLIFSLRSMTQTKQAHYCDDMAIFSQANLDQWQPGQTEMALRAARKASEDEDTADQEETEEVPEDEGLALDPLTFERFSHAKGDRVAALANRFGRLVLIGSWSWSPAGLQIDEGFFAHNLIQVNERLCNLTFVDLQYSLPLGETINELELIHPHTDISFLIMKTLPETTKPLRTEGLKNGIFFR